MKKTILSFALLAAGFCSVSQAAILLSSNNSGGGGRQITTSTGTLLTGGSMHIGYFADPAAAGLRSGDWSYIATNFIPLGEGRAGLGGGTAGVAPILIPSAAANGRYTGSVSGITGTNQASDPTTASTSVLNQGTRLFLLALDVPSMSTAPTQFALVSDSTLWKAPKDDPLIPGGASLTLALNRTNIAPGEEATDVFWGTLASDSATVNFLRLAPPVPEPSTSLMAVLAGLGLIDR